MEEAHVVDGSTFVKGAGFVTCDGSPVGASAEGGGACLVGPLRVLLDDVKTVLGVDGDICGEVENALWGEELCQEIEERRVEEATGSVFVSWPGVGEEDRGLMDALRFEVVGENFEDVTA